LATGIEFFILRRAHVVQGRMSAPAVIEDLDDIAGWSSVIEDLSVEAHQPVRSSCREETRTEAAEIIRSLVDEIVLTPENGEFKIDLRGDLAGILTIATNAKRPLPGGNGLSIDELASQVELVAGTRNQLKVMLCIAA
jgi:hypothetical protein